MQGTIESKVFSRRASVHVHFWVTGDQIAGSVPNRNTRPFIFLVGSRILCGSDLFVLIVLLWFYCIFVIYSTELDQRALVFVSGAFLIYFWYARDALCFWLITSILSLLVHASLRCRSFPSVGDAYARRSLASAKSRPFFLWIISFILIVLLCILLFILNNKILRFFVILRWADQQLLLYLAVARAPFYFG